MKTAQLFDRAFTEVSRSATISDCTLYRYDLRRWWDDEKPWALFWMLNPSAADAAIDDPTIRRCMSFARREGCGGLMVVNWFAWRAVDPPELREATHPIGRENDWHIRTAISLCKGPLIAAWGAHPIVKPRLPELPGLIGSRQLVCLGRTKDASPRHPLYVRADATLIVYREAVSRA